ncbi:MAG: hypothetical protein Q9217_003252 [Psora testacea]
MTGRRTSARQAAKASSNPASSQTDASASTGSKRKASSGAQPKSKRGKKKAGTEQSTIEASMPMKGHNGESKDVEMKDETGSGKADTANGGASNGAAEDAKDNDGAETARKVEENTKEQTDDGDEAEEQTHKTKENGFDKIMSKEDDEPKNVTNEGTGSKVSASDNAVEESSKREEATPSNILEKGLIYFFFRGRVGVDEPKSVNDVARSYIILRPLPQGAKLGEGPIGDAGNNRMLALPKKVLPVSPKDRFMTFVEKANCSMDEIKERLSSSDYSTKTVGVRHTPAATPIAEGVYAMTQTGRDTHLAYILTIPSELDQVQKDVGLRQRGSYYTSAKNPQSLRPANVSLPQGAEYPQDIQDEFGNRGWMPLLPKLLNYQNTQFLLIGHKEDALEKAAQPQDGEDPNEEKETPLEEIEKLEGEDEGRVKGLDEDHAIFTDLGLSLKEYPKLQTTW